jgi:nicotinamide riboside transporter PnuC
MSCNKCKKKEKIDFIEKEMKKLERPVIIGLTIFGMLSIYGIYQLLLKIFTLF